jgi:hypothetical protein
MYDSINEDMDDEFMKEIIKARKTTTVKIAKSAFIKEIRGKLNAFRFNEVIERITSKLSLILSANDEVVLKYAKFEMIFDALNGTYKFLQDDNETQIYKMPLKLLKMTINRI